MQLSIELYIFSFATLDTFFVETDVRNECISNLIALVGFISHNFNRSSIGYQKVIGDFDKSVFCGGVDRSFDCASHWVCEAARIR